MSDTTVGVDISKKTLDVHRLSDGVSAEFSNDKTGMTRLIRWLGEGVARIVFEPTGHYHRDFERRLAVAGYPLVKVNPRHAKRFAQALGTRAKTDRADAAMLARMGAALELAPQPVKSEVLQDLNALQVARQALLKDRTAAKNRGYGVRLGLLKRQNAARLKQIETDLAALDLEISRMIRDDPDLTTRAVILTSIPGISDVTAAAMLTLMPELGTLDQRQAASLAGLAPITRQSGTWRGKSLIQGGRAALRRALYMPALVACRFNPDLKAKYRQFIGAGKPPKLAITAIMRKLLVLANALLRDGRKWSPETP